MATIYCPKEESLEAIIQKIKEAQEESLTLSIEKGSVYWQNKTNESILLQIAQKYNKTIVIDHWAEDDNTPITEVPEVSTTMISDAPKNKTADKKQRKESKLRLWFKFPRVLVIIGFLLLVFVGSASAYIIYYLPQAEVLLSVSKKNLRRDETVVLRPEQETVDVQSLSIPVKIETVNVEETREFAATGTKTIGDKATGAITVYNWSDVQVTFDVGQTFTVNQNQEGAGFVYIATEQVSVGARTDESSGPGQSTRTAGTATVFVQAEDVGAIYNLPAELYFTVSGYSFGDDDGQMQGYNTQLFTGGNTEEVTIVAEGDILDAFETLKADLEPRAREELESKQNGRRLISEYLPINVANNVSDKEAGDEADVFNVTTALGATGYFYSQDDVQTLFESLFMDDIPEGFTLSDENVSVSVSYVGLTEEGYVQVSVSGEVLLVPELDRDALKAELSGDRLEEAQNYISSIEHVSEGSIEVWPRLPGSLQRLPYRPERISITIQEE